MTSMQCVTAMSNASMAATMISIILNVFYTWYLTHKYDPPSLKNPHESFNPTVIFSI